MKLTPLQLNRVSQLRNSMMMDAILGNYKDFKNAKKEYASIVIQDFDAIKKLPAQKAEVPLFSKYGLRMIYVMIRDFFRIKTPEEKCLKKMGKKAKAESFIKQV